MQQNQNFWASKNIEKAIFVTLHPLKLVFHVKSDMQNNSEICIPLSMVLTPFTHFRLNSALFQTHFSLISVSIQTYSFAPQSYNHFLFTGWRYQCPNLNQLHLLQRRIWGKSRSTRSHQKMVMVNCGKDVPLGKTRLGLLLDWFSSIASLWGRIPTHAIRDHSSGRWYPFALSQHLHFSPLRASVFIKSCSQEQIIDGH